MATNFEFYKDEILEITRDGDGIALKDRELIHCNECACCDCEFNAKNFYPNCNSELFKWLYAEHIEPPKLTKRERAFCEVVRVGWIARDEDGNLHLFDLIGKPYKQNREWLKTSVSCNHIWLNSDEFDFIKWTDEEPWCIEDLLKLEVQKDA